MISINNLNVSFGGFTLFSDVNFHIGTNDKIGLVGKNGSGKSTILKIISGLVLPSSGDISVTSDENIGYLPQEMEYNTGRTVIEEAMTAFSYLDDFKKDIERISGELAVREDFESKEYQKLIIRLNELHDKLIVLDDGSAMGETEKVLMGLGFKPGEFNNPTSALSKGWNMRIALAKILLSSPSTLLLDEPTNHLDIESIQWLEDYLLQFRGSLILVSHDRKFLDSVTNRTVELMSGKIHDYRVPYSRYIDLRKERIDQLKAAYENQQRTIEKSEEFIERFRYKATKSNQVQSRIKQLNKIERIELEEEDLSKINVRFPNSPRSGNMVVKTTQLSKNYGDKRVFANLDAIISRGEKIALVGRNGEGKTTFMKLLSGEIEPSDGAIELGHNVQLGYYAQNQEELLNGDDTVYDTLDNIAVGDVRTRLRDILGAFLFRGDDIEKRVEVLSGGEKSRLAMAKLMLKPYNLLALDEPTNHMDIKSKEVLKKALLNYDGTLIIVSHDRDFLDNLVTKVLEFKDGRVREHIGSITQYLDRVKLDNTNTYQIKKQTISEDREISASKLKRAEDKETRRRRQSIERCENEIEEVEAEILVIENELAGISDPKKIDSLIDKYDLLKERLNRLLTEWEKLHI